MDGIAILLDKSVLEMLNADELSALFKHYFLVLPPILITEIIGDLYSVRRDSKQTGIQTEQVQKLAKKIVTQIACRNVDYRSIRAAELLGKNVDHLGFRPIVAPTKTSFDDDGNEMALIEQDTEFEVILKWQKGEFSISDEEYANAWKNSSPTDLADYKRELKESEFDIDASDLAEIRSQLELRYRAASIQDRLLTYSCSRAKFSIEEMLFVRRRWEVLGRPLFCDFAPYAYFCFLVEMVFVYGLAKGVVRTSKNAKSAIDLQYVFYFPFTRVFSSHDMFHSQLWSVFGDPQQQSFVWGADFKTDLNHISFCWQNASAEELQSLYESAPYPPVLKNSISVGLFDKLEAMGKVPSRDQIIQNRQTKRTPDEERAIVQSILARYKKLKGN